MNINLTPELESFIRSLVATGDYNNASEVMREAARDLRAKKQLAVQRDPYAELLASGLADLRANRLVDADDAFWANSEARALKLAEAGYVVPWHISGEAPE
jgi:antitoxin ParD1/3/4